MIIIYSQTITYISKYSTLILKYCSCKSLYLDRFEEIYYPPRTIPVACLIHHVPTAVFKQKHNILFSLHCSPFSEVLNTHKNCWRGNKLCSHQIVHDSKQLLFHWYNFSSKEARVERGTCATAASVCWLRLRASQNDRCSPEVLIWTAASEQAGD